MRKKCGGESQWISNSLPGFWQLANQIFLDFYPNIFLKSAGTRVIEHTILGGFPNEPTGFQLLLFTLTQFSLASSAMTLRQDKVQNNQVHVS